MRLFIAIDIDDETRAQLALARAAIQEVVGRARIPPRITWVKDDCAHVTLRFIGETSETTAAKIQHALVPSWPIAPFEVCWAQLGAFPSARRPRVLWIGPRSADDLVHLATHVQGRLEALIGPGEARPFKPHLTLGRVKESGTDVDWRGAIDARVWAPTTTRVGHVTLYLSRLSPKGPTYTALCKARL